MPMTVDDPTTSKRPRTSRWILRVGLPRALSRNGLCSAVVSVARANDLPIPFFANLIWQESSFNTKTDQPRRRAGHRAVHAADGGRIRLDQSVRADPRAQRRRTNSCVNCTGQFGNLGLAAAAYNAGPRRVIDWMAKRGALPGETRNYVLAHHRPSGRGMDVAAKRRRDPEATLMPAKAPCVEVAEAVKAQAEVVRVSKLMVELARPRQPPARDDRDGAKPGDTASKVAHAMPDRKTRAAARMAKAALAEAREQKSRRTSAKTHRVQECVQDRGQGTEQSGDAVVAPARAQGRGEGNAEQSRRQT